MKLTIEIPEFSVANFKNPSPELLQFVGEFKDLCVRLTEQYRSVDGEKLFFAYIRDGAKTVYCTNSSSTRKIAWGRRKSSMDDQEYAEQGFALFPRDQPGNWIVAELFIDGWGGSLEFGSLVLGSWDFTSYRGHRPKAETFLGRVIDFLGQRVHAVPRSKPKQIARSSQ